MWPEWGQRRWQSLLRPRQPLALGRRSRPPPCQFRKAVWLGWGRICWQSLLHPRQPLALGRSSRPPRCRFRKAVWPEWGRIRLQSLLHPRQALALMRCPRACRFPEGPIGLRPQWSLAPLWPSRLQRRALANRRQMLAGFRQPPQPRRSRSRPAGSPAPERSRRARLRPRPALQREHRLKPSDPQATLASSRPRQARSRQTLQPPPARRPAMRGQARHPRLLPRRHRGPRPPPHGQAGFVRAWCPPLPSAEALRSA